MKIKRRRMKPFQFNPNKCLVTKRRRWPAKKK
jgi:hypothetical protein